MVAYRQQDLAEQMQRPVFGEYWMSDGVGSYKIHRDELTGTYTIYDQHRAESRTDLVKALNDGLRTLAAKVAR